MPPPKKRVVQTGEPSEQTGLLHPDSQNVLADERRPAHRSSVDPSHLSPVTPLIPAAELQVPPPKKPSRVQNVLMNLFAVLMVCAAGVLGWWLSNSSQSGPHHGHHDEKKAHQGEDDALQLNALGQFFGYLCAVFYLGSRVPQLLLNWRRKSTEGISILFFLFACIGNLTYVLSIFAYEPHCGGERGECRPGEAGRIYGRYILANASWLVGSAGTLFLDAAIFAQFFLYREGEEGAELEDEEITNGNGNGNVDGQDDRPLLQRGDSTFARI